MNKRHSRGGRIRLVRYGPEVQTCIHSRCPSPSHVPEKPGCTCGNRCELHCTERRSQSPSSITSSSFEPAVRCRSCGGFHATKWGRSPQAEKTICTCNKRCELHTREDRPRPPTNSESSECERNWRCPCDWCRVARRELRANRMRPSTSSCSDSSDSECARKYGGHRYAASREPETSPPVERWHREVYTRTNTPATSTNFSSPRTSFTAATHPAPLVHHHHCHKAMYCQKHPELCRATPSPVPKLTPTWNQSHQTSGKSRRGIREKFTRIQPKCTCGRHLSPEPVTPHQDGPLKPAPKAGVQHCSCFHVERYYVDEPGYYTPYEDDTASATSMFAMPASDGNQDESHCPLYHRCCPRFEHVHGWVCGRK
jgi:hypothetical protein